MSEIVPAIIAKSFSELEQKVKLVEPFVKTVQLDIVDGDFVPNTTWPYLGGQTIADLARLETGLFLEAHLMVAEPENVMDAWLESRVGRIIVHWEAVNSSKFKVKSSKLGIWDLINKTHKVGKQFGIALNLETPIETLDEFIDGIDLVLLMAVNPGFSGQEFQEKVIHKALALRQKHKSIKIEVDGGINKDNAKKLAQAKVDFLAIGSAIFESGDIEKIIGELKSA